MAQNFLIIGPKFPWDLRIRDNGGMLILVVAGDPSGDVHAAGVIAALKKQSPDLRVAAVGGPACRAVSDEFLEDLAGRGVTGFWEPLLKIGFLVSLGRRIRRYIKEKEARRGHLRRLLRL